MSRLLNPLITKQNGFKGIIYNLSDYKLTLGWILRQESLTLILWLITWELKVKLKDISEWSSL